MIKINLSIYNDRQFAVVVQGDTYPVKETLKELGYRWSRIGRLWKKMLRDYTDEDLDLYFMERKAPADMQEEIDALVNALGPDANIKIELI